MALSPSSTCTSTGPDTRADQIVRRVVLPVAERAGSELLSLPLSPAHSDEDIQDAIAALRAVHARF